MGKLAIRGALTLLASTCLAGVAQASTNYYVDPANGSDQASGASVDAAFRTLARAKQAVRSVNATMKDDIVVNLRGGTYSLTTPLVLDTADSGMNGHTVIWKAYASETPLITSARRVTGWRSVGNGQYKAAVGAMNFRQMFVNGVRATRSRHPEVGSFGQLLKGDRAAETLTTSSVLVGNWANLPRVEMSLLMQWAESYLRLASITPQGDRADIRIQKYESDIFFQRPFPLLKENSPLFFQNAREFLNTPGEFYVDTDERAVYYMPRNGETLSAASVIVPTLETLVQIKGSSLDAPAHDIRFSGITFADTTWLYPNSRGHMNEQGGMYSLAANMQNEQYVGRPPAAVSAAWADRLQFDGNTFTRAGASALDLHNGVHQSAIVGNVVYDISGNGIVVGKFSDPDYEDHLVYNPPITPAGEDPREVTRDVDVLNNLVTRIGQDYFGTAAINAGFVNTVNIRNNEVTAVPWAGISLGWGWQKAANALGNNHVDRNEVAAAVGMLCDTAAVYHLSNDPGTTIDANYFHDITRSPSACPHYVGGFYLDEGTSNVFVRDNVMQTVENPKIFNFTGPNNVVQNNEGQSSATIKAAGLEAPYRSLRNRVNLAYNRPTSSSSVYAAPFAAGRANDGNVGSGWSPTASDTAAWWQVDLGQPYQLGSFSIVTRQDMDQPDSRTNFEVQASNDPNFADFTVIGRQDRWTRIPFSGTLTRQVVDNGAYRYVRVAKTDTNYLFISEFSVGAGGGEAVSYPAPDFDPARYYTIKNVNSGKLLDVSGEKTEPGTRLQQWAATGAKNQQFQIVKVSGNLFKIVARHSGLVLDVKDGSSYPGAGINQYAFEGTNHQLWYFQPAADGTWVIRSFRSDLALEIGGESVADGAAAAQWTYYTQNNQRWTIE